MLDPNFWQDKINSKNTIKEKKLFEDLVNSFSESNKQLNELTELQKLALEENDQNVQKEILENLKKLRNLVKKTKLNVFFLKKLTL